mgnify:CR=1 FL=1
MQIQIGNRKIKKPNTEFWLRVMMWHLPVLHDYALRKLEKWYFEDEPLLFEQQRLDAISRAKAHSAEMPKF